ncbi:proline racemase family protein [Sulfobacillus harzensis]|uniref:Proline racemase family protein n=1 Tax=Sulfobacillus harzensis TaxID=2729629 RepID=A0A7Y0L179_9FIRM|nr:proline racemase family protein [Sulfobacillus harzensis]NMP21426.1 proline racemase family protein [Sulfobacillus harzensis]
MNIREVFDVIDLHAGGEPLRVIMSGYPAIPPGTILDKRDYVASRWDRYRQRLLFEPWGHEGMYGCLVVEPERPDSDFGLLLMHNQGYSAMCGNATLAVTKLFVETGRVPIAESRDQVVIRYDVPCGQVEAHAELKNGRVERVSFDNVPAFPVALNQTVRVRGRDIMVDVAFGGAYYAILPSAALDLTVEPESLDSLVDGAAEIKAAVAALDLTRHPIDDRLSGLYGVIFTDTPHDTAHLSRQVAIFADGQVDRSPCGSGVSARLAVLDAKGEIQPRQDYGFESVIDTVFVGRVTGDAGTGIRTTIAGHAYVTGFRRFYGNPAEMVEPFLMR